MLSGGKVYLKWLQGSCLPCPYDATQVFPFYLPMIFILPSASPFSLMVPLQVGRRLQMVVLVVVMVAGVHLVAFLHILHLPGVIDCSYPLHACTRLCSFRTPSVD